MADRVYLHIGAPKSGTTFLQTVMWNNQQRLREAGVLLPGQRRGDHTWTARWARSTDPSPYTRRTWRRVSSELRDFDGSVVLSSEWFTMVSPPLVERFLAELAPAEIHVVMTARNFVSSVPAAWQERVKLGHAVDLDAFIVSLDTNENRRWNWGTLDPSIVLPRWSTFLPPSRIHVVTVPPSRSDPDLLWRRFAQACDMAWDVCDLGKAFANESISAESARLLQLIGPELRKAVDADTVGGYLPYRWIRDYLSHRVLAVQQGSKIALSAEELTILHERSARLVESLKRENFDVVGDLDELVGGDVPQGAIRPEQVSDEAVLQVALAAIPPLLGRLRKERERGDREAAEAVRLRQELLAARAEARVAAGPAPSVSDQGRALARRVGRRLPEPVRRGLSRMIRTIRARRSRTLKP